MRVEIKKLSNSDKKYKATFYENDTKVKTTRFGSAGMSDYTIHKDDDRKQRYLDRFRSLIKKYKDNPMSAMTLSANILWNKPSLKTSIADYKNKFNLL